MSTHPLLNNEFPSAPKHSSRSNRQVRWCPRCEEQGLVFRHRRGDRAYWRCQACQYEVNFQAEPTTQAEDTSWHLPWEIVLTLLIAGLFLVSANVLEARLRSVQDVSMIMRLPSFSDLK